MINRIAPCSPTDGWARDNYSPPGFTLDGRMKPAPNTQVTKYKTQMRTEVI